MARVVDSVMDFLKRSKTGQRIAEEVEEGEATAAQRAEAAANLADALAKLPAAQNRATAAKIEAQAKTDAATAKLKTALRESELARDMKAMKSARQTYAAGAATIQKPAAEAATEVRRLCRQRDKSLSILRSTADARIDAFAMATWQHFQARRDDVCRADEQLTGDFTIAGKAVFIRRNNAVAVTAWIAAIHDVRAKCEAMKLDPSADGEIDERLAVLQNAIDDAESNLHELQVVGERIGDGLAMALANAPTVNRVARGVKQPATEVYSD